MSSGIGWADPSPLTSLRHPPVSPVLGGVAPETLFVCDVLHVLREQSNVMTFKNLKFIAKKKSARYTDYRKTFLSKCKRKRRQEISWSHLEWESPTGRETCMRRHLRVASVFVRQFR